MDKADQEYFRLLKTIINDGKWKKNRTGIDTIGVFGEQAKFKIDLEAFPILTTKRVWFKGILHELLFFINGQTNNNYLKQNGVGIWNEWGDNYGNLGPIYSHQWRFFGGKHKNRPQPKPLKITKRFPLEKPTFKNGGFIGKTFSSSSCGEFIVLDHCGGRHYKIQFLETGFKNIVREDHLLNGSVEDKYAPLKFGIACKGQPKNVVYLKDAYIRWCGMISRCYNTNQDHFNYYGGKGVYVCDRWLCFEDFLEDVPKLEGFDIDNFSGLEIDKDKYGDGFVYSPETCCWLLKSCNQQERYKNEEYCVQHEDGRIRHVKCQSNFIKDEGINSQSNFSAVLRGERSKCEGWSLLSKKGNLDGIDQLKNIIECLKKNPDDRRMIVSAWNPVDFPHMSLPCCHVMFHFNTEELTINERHEIYEKGVNSEYQLLPKYLGSSDSEAHKCYDDSGVPKRRLNCLLYQRSCDTFLGVPFNITSYCLLTAMIAHCVNMIPGIFTHTYGDLHIYKNHIPQVLEQLKRDPKPLPKLWINPAKKNLFDLKYSDIKLIGYNPHPTIKGDVAI